MPCLQRTGDEGLGARGLWRPQKVGVGEEQAWLGGPLTLWHLDGSTAEAAKQVGDDVVFDFVLGEPGEHREQPKHHGFDLGRGTSGGQRGRFPVSAAPAWTQYPVTGHLFVQNSLRIW